MKRIKLVVAALLIASFMGSAGCNRHGWYIFGELVEVAAYVAITAAVLAAHDAHYHHYHCGHHWVVYEERPVYHYQGRWEYYDPYARTWYYYPDGIPGY
ncbi:MAG: hypothetical protein IT385_03015 [Deltaproteobacteria bacterium]|nr:hypothetical protein [Deltaproteobacteria bacterium]